MAIFPVNINQSDRNRLITLLVALGVMKFVVVMFVGILIGYAAFLLTMSSGYTAGVAQFVAAIVSLGTGFSLSSICRKLGWI